MYPSVPDRHLPAINTLTARSVALSTLLGYHPPALPIRALIRVGALFGIAERATRVALTRMVKDGDVAVADGVYRLSDRLVRRQAKQDEISCPQTREWSGRWQMAVVTGTARPLAERVALRKSMVAFRMAELREGIWLRPDNLSQKPAEALADQCMFFASEYGDARGLSEQLWDLPGWALEAHRLLELLDEADELVEGFMATAEVIRHLLLDPYLPDQLLPPGWPGNELRERYAEFNIGYAQQLREYSEG
jgi:phenylacetic acid degradation operon negative regulatory protein